MAGKFNNLEDVRNTLLAANFDFNTLPANNKYRKYKEYKEDPDKRKLPDGSARNRGSDKPVQLSPFGLAKDPDNDVLVGVSGRAFTEITASLGGLAVFNLTGDPSDNVRERVGFIPAKAIMAVRLPEPKSISRERNRTTGQAYKTRSGATFTVPFGAQVETDREFSVQGEILAARNATHYVTFTPERLRRS